MDKYKALGIAILLSFPMIFFPGMVIEGTAKNYNTLKKLDNDMRKVFELGIRCAGILILVVWLIAFFTGR